MDKDLTVTTVAAVIAGYRPRTMPEGAGAFARAVVAAVEPSSPARAKALLWSCAKLASFGLSVGLAPEPAARAYMSPRGSPSPWPPSSASRIPEG